MDTILNGWSENRKQCNPLVIAYWNFREDLSVLDEVILKGEKIVIPKVLRSQTLDALHPGHLGVEKCLKRTRVTLLNCLTISVI